MNIKTDSPAHIYWALQATLFYSIMTKLFNMGDWTVLGGFLSLTCYCCQYHNNSTANSFLSVSPSIISRLWQHLASRPGTFFCEPSRVTSLKSSSKALKQISRSGPPNDWLHTALTPHSFRLVVFRSLSSLHPEEEPLSSQWESKQWGGKSVMHGPSRGWARGSSLISAVTCL